MPAKKSSGKTGATTKRGSRVYLKLNLTYEESQALKTYADKVGGLVGFTLSKSQAAEHLVKQTLRKATEGKS